MGIFSKLNPWCGPATHILLVDNDKTAVSRQIASHVAAMGLTCERVSTVRRAARSDVIQFLNLQAAIQSPLQQLVRSSQIVVHISSQDISGGKEPFEELADIDSLSIIADCAATAAEMQESLVAASTHVIHEGIQLADFSPTRINERLAARRKLKIPRDAVCVGVFENLGDAEQGIVVETFVQLKTAIGPIALLCLDSENNPSKAAEHELGAKAIPVIRCSPGTLVEMQECFAALDLYISVSQIGDLRGILRCWATGVPVASTPNRVATDILLDGITAAISESATGRSLAGVAAELHLNEEFRHGCCQRAREAVQPYAWPRVLKQYESLYQHLLPRGRAAA